VSKSKTPIYQIKIALRHVAPSVWRRIEAPADIKLGKLHRVLQIAMGWTDSHLHAYRIGGATYGVPNPDFPDDTQSERDVRLDKVVGVGDTLIYEYDFGDGWEHTLKIEKIISADPAAHYPRCTGGSRACPPEDCGGPPGYEHLLQVLRDPKHEEHEQMREWIGGDFDPEAFDLGKANQRLWRMK
jgi:hypothetical protein